MKIDKWIVQIYLFLMFGIFPIYYQNGYYNMGDAKYAFFKYVTIALFVMAGSWVLFEKLQTIGKNKTNVRKIKLSVQDCIVLIYLGIAVFSWLMSPYRKEAWIGSTEWYMGVFTQILFVGTYFVVSRYMPEKKWTLVVMGAGAAIVFLISYLHRFRIDPLGLYDGVSEKYWLSFLGTIGNANWYSSYICVILPILAGVYMLYEHQRSLVNEIGHLLNAGAIFLGFATAVTQNSDSVYSGLVLGLLFLLWFAFEKKNYFRHFLEILLLGLCAAKITGCLQMAFPEKAMLLSDISMEITQGKMTWYMLGSILFLYVIVISQEKKIVDWTNIKIIRNICYIILGVLFLLTPLLIWLVSTGKVTLETGIISKTGYLVFNDKWGTNRGKIWKYAIEIFREYPLTMKMFGCGPDALMHYTNEFHHTAALSFGKSEILTNVHNEWLNMMISCGMLGAGAYLAIFITSIINVIKHWGTTPMLLAFGASIVAYMGHNFFCFQQVVCTSLIFMIIAMTEGNIKSR